MMTARMIANLRNEVSDAVSKASVPSGSARNMLIRIHNNERTVAIKEAIFYHLIQRMNWRIANGKAIEGDTPQLQYSHLVNKMDYARNHERKLIKIVRIGE